MVSSLSVRAVSASRIEAVSDESWSIRANARANEASMEALSDSS